MRFLEIPKISDFAYHSSPLFGIQYGRLPFFRLATRTDAFQNVVDSFHFETVGQVDYRCRYAFQAVGVLAFGTEKMRVLVVVAHAVVVVVVAAGFVLDRAAAVVNLVHQVVLAEGAQASEYRALVYCFKGVFQVVQAHGVFCLQQGFEDQQAGGGWLYVVQQQALFYFVMLVHTVFFVAQRYS